MKDKGFIMLNRKLFSHRIWRASRMFSECEAWIDLIQSARFEETETTERIGYREITYGRGQFPASISFLVDRWGWTSDKKVRNFLEMLKNEGMITTDGKQGANVITLCKYDEYNSLEKGQAKGEAKGKGESMDISIKINELEHELKGLRASQKASKGQGEGQAKGEQKGNNINKDINNNISPYNPPGDPGESGDRKGNFEKINYQGVIDYFNQTFDGKLAKVDVLSDSRRKAIKARIAEFGKEAVAKVFKLVLQSPFLMGDNDRNWKVNFDWIFKSSNFVKIMEGNYLKQKENETAETTKRYDNGDILR